MRSLPRRKYHQRQRRPFHQRRKTRKKGIILCQITEEGIDKKNIEQAVLSESPLFTMGYHVNSHYNLSQVQRWKILESIIDEEILSKDEVVEHIDRFIDQNKYKSSAARARLKWKIDQEHIAGYRKKRDYPQPARTKANTSDSTTKSQKIYTTKQRIKIQLKMHFNRHLTPKM